MNIDLVGAVELTASAAIITGALSIGVGRSTASRDCIAFSLSLWFVLVVILAATRALYYEHGLGAPGLGLAVLAPVVLLCAIVARTKSLHENRPRAPMCLLLGDHVVQ